MNKKSKIHFEVSERKILLRFFDALFALSALYFAGDFFKIEYLYSIFSKNYYILLLTLYLNVLGTIFEMYNLQVANDHYKIMQSTILTVSTTAFFFMLTPMLSNELPENRIQIMLFYVVLFFSIMTWRLFYLKFLNSDLFIKNVLLICDQSNAHELSVALETSDPHYKIIAVLNSNKLDCSVNHTEKAPKVSLDNLSVFATNYNLFEIIVAMQHSAIISAELYKKLLELMEAGITIREYTQVYEDKTYRVPLNNISAEFFKFFQFSRSSTNQLYLFHVRILELLLSFFGLIITLLIVPIILLANFIGNPGDLIYTQLRVGRNGKLFKIYKFRTILDKKQFTNKNATVVHRITPFGKFMRKTRIDEFPQFINILKGEMAVIGPRPELPKFVEEISRQMPIYQTRHTIKPGITGWAQVNFPYGESIEDSLIKLQYDLYYIKHRNIILDLDITLKTLSTILFYRGQ